MELDGERRSYRWLVLIVTFFINGLTLGLLYSVGVLYKDWVQYFNEPSGYVSIAGSLPTAIACISGPIYGFLTDKVGGRASGFVGGIIMAVGMAVSSLAESVMVLCVTFGLIAGFGAGMCCFASCGVINDYFLHNRMLAEGVLGGGLCLGNFTLSLLQQYLGNEYTWKGALFITSAICLHCSLGSLFFIPSKIIGIHPLNFWKRYDAKKHELEEFKIEDSRQNNLQLVISDENKNVAFEDKKKDLSKDKLGFFRRSLRLWKNPIFLMIVTSDFFTWIAIFVPYVHLVERARIEGMDENTAAWLSSVIGLAGIIGRPFTGIVCNYFSFNPFWSYCAVQMSCGFATILSSFWSDSYGLFTFAVLFGFLSNGYGFIKTSAAVMLGTECFVDAYSWMLLLEGIGIAVGPPLAGLIYDATNSYNWSFRFSGGILIISALICFLKSTTEKFHKRNQQRRFHRNSTSQSQVLM